MRGLIALALAASTTAAQAGGWATINRWLHQTGRCGPQREVIATHYCSPGGPLAGGGHMRCADLIAASWAYPMGSTIQVKNPISGKACWVKIADTGPNGIARRMGAVLDLSSGAADCLGTGRGTVYVCAP